MFKSMKNQFFVFSKKKQQPKIHFQVDFDELELKLNKVENECRASFDHLRVISKHETPQVKTKYVLIKFNFNLSQTINKNP